LGVQGDVAVGAQFAERHVQPVRGADLHDGIDCEIKEFALAQAGAACRSLVNAASSRNLGSGSSRSGRSPGNMSTRAGMSSPSHSVSRSKQVRRVPRCSARLILDNLPPRAEGRVDRCSL
jgi:hypothetical protein